MNPSRNRSRPVPVGGIMDRIMSGLGLSRRYYGWLVVSRWAEIVGEHYARHSHAVRFEDGTLVVAVSDPGWRQQLALDNDKILRIIHGFPNGEVVKKLRLIHGQKGNVSNGDSR